MKWTPDKVNRSLRRTRRPGWCRGGRDHGQEQTQHDRLAHGQTQHTIGNAIVRASCILQAYLEMSAFSAAEPTSSAAMQRAGRDRRRVPARLLRHCAGIVLALGGMSGTSTWKCFASEALMTKPGTTVSRWIDAVLEPNDMIGQAERADRVLLGRRHRIDETRGLEMKKAMDALDLLVVVDPCPLATAAMAAMPSLKVPRSIRTAPSTCFPHARSSRHRAPSRPQAVRVQSA